MIISEKQSIDKDLCPPLLGLFSQLLDHKFLIDNDKVIKNRNISLSILKVFENFTRINQDKVYFSPCLSLLSQIQNSNLRLIIIAILKNLSSDNDALDQALNLLQKMNTYDRTMLDNSFDYDVVIDACYK